MPSFIEEMINDIFIIGNHHACGICKETFEERGNEILRKSKQYLLDNKNIDINDKIKIKCYQFWLVGFLSGQNFNVYEDNAVDPNIN